MPGTNEAYHAPRAREAGGVSTRYSLLSCYARATRSPAISGTDVGYAATSWVLRPSMTWAVPSAYGPTRPLCSTNFEKIRTSGTGMVGTLYELRRRWTGRYYPSRGTMRCPVQTERRMLLGHVLRSRRAVYSISELGTNVCYGGRTVWYTSCRNSQSISSSKATKTTQPVLNSAIPLCIRYAMSGTGAESRLSWFKPANRWTARRHLYRPPMALRVHYAMSGTEGAVCCYQTGSIPGPSEYCKSRSRPLSVYIMSAPGTAPLRYFRN
eukprot:2304605-Rhodomonas_salina.3